MAGNRKSAVLPVPQWGVSYEEVGAEGVVCPCTVGCCAVVGNTGIPYKSSTVQKMLKSKTKN